MNDGKLRSEPLFSIELDGFQFKQVDLTTLQSSIFPVVVRTGSEIRSIGTCFAISNHGLCLTARHVIEDVEVSGEINDEGNPTFAHEVGVIYVNPDYEDLELSGDQIFGGFIPIRTVHLIDGTDIGLMHLNLPVRSDTGEQLFMPANRLTLSIPMAAEKIFAFGYDQGDWSQENDGTNVLQHNFKATQGEVTQIFPMRRDSAVLPFPCFESTATFLSGMSGGPVISETGFVIGVITSAFSFCDDGQSVSYASLLAPAMHINLLAKADDGSERPCFLWDFAEGGAIIVERGSAMIERSHDQLSIRSGQVLYQSKIGT